VTAAAYKSLCDGMITEERLIDLTSVEGDPDDVGSTIGSTAPVLSPGGVAYYPGGIQTKSGPVPRVSDRAPERPQERSLEPVYESTQDRPRPQDKRRPPAKIESEPAEAALVDQLGRPLKIAPELAALARRVNAATNVPMFASEIYAALFRAIADDVRDSGFSFNRTINAVIRRLGDMGLKLRPQHVAFVVKGLMLSGHEFVDTDTPATLAKGFRRQVLYLCASEDMNLSEAERGAVGMWIVGGLRNLSESEILSSEPITSDASVAAEVAGIDPDEERSDDIDLAGDEDVSDHAAGSPDMVDGEPEISDPTLSDPDPEADPARLSGNDVPEKPVAAATDPVPAKVLPDIGGLLARIRSART
jgi:hypothetical protein